MTLEEIRAEIKKYKLSASRSLNQDYATGFISAMSAVEGMLASLKQPEIPKGQWELIQDHWNVYQCSDCKEWWTLESGTPQDNNMNFCPFCGCDMRGEEE